MRRRSALYVSVLVVLLFGVVILAGTRFRSLARQEPSFAIPVGTSGPALGADKDHIADVTLFRDIVRRQNPVVVSITTESRVNALNGNDLDSIRRAQEDLRRAVQTLADARSRKGTPASASASDGASGSGGDVVDAELVDEGKS